MDVTGKVVSGFRVPPRGRFGVFVVVALMVWGLVSWVIMPLGRWFCSESLYGQWRCESHPQVLFDFNADGTFMIQDGGGSRGRWKKEGEIYRFTHQEGQALMDDEDWHISIIERGRLMISPRGQWHRMLIFQRL